MPAAFFGGIYMYKIKLLIGGSERTFTRDGEPVLRDITHALKVQSYQFEMYSKGTPTDEQFDENEKRLAEFAVDFWGGQFTVDQVINGATLATLDVINKAISDSLGPEDNNEKK